MGQCNDQTENLEDATSHNTTNKQTPQQIFLTESNPVCTVLIVQSRRLICPHCFNFGDTEVQAMQKTQDNIVCVRQYPYVWLGAP